MHFTSNPKRLSIFTTALALLVTGCTTSKMPWGSQVVGGGLSVDWRAHVDGSVVLREECTRRIVATQSLGAGDNFEFPTSAAHHEALAKLFGDPMPTNLSFVLYFTPKKAGVE